MDDIHWLVGPRAGGDELDSIGYGDGSAKENWSLVLVRCGWGLCTLNAQGLVCDRLYGPLPGWDQRVPVAEAWAFLIYLRLAVPVKITFVTDCKYVRDTFHSGAGAGTRSGDTAPLVWRMIWTRVLDRGSAEDVVVRWVPAHTTVAAVEAGRISGTDRMANGLADLLAKKGAGLHADKEGVVLRTTKAMTVVKQIVIFIGRAVHDHLSRLPRDDRERAADKGARAATQDLAPLSRPKQLQSLVLGPLREAGAHEVAWAGTRRRCVRCLRSAAKLAPFKLFRCGGPRSGEVTLQGTEATEHYLCKAGPYLFCSSCGAYSRYKTRKLGKQCNRVATVAMKRARGRLMVGQHPVSGMPILAGEGSDHGPFCACLLCDESEWSKAALSKLGFE